MKRQAGLVAVGALMILGVAGGGGSAMGTAGAPLTPRCVSLMVANRQLAAHHRRASWRYLMGVGPS